MAQNGNRNDFTSRLIKAHIRPGMRVLDVGCGNGEISFLIADAAGSNGNVDGVDINSAAIEAAQQRQRELNAYNVNFLTGDIAGLADSDEGRYDAVFGRRVLMYQPDPLGTIRTLKRLLNPGGIMLFQESDENGSLLNGDDLKLHNLAQDWIWRTVQYEGGDTRIGSELYGMMQAAGMHVIDYCAEAVLQTPESGSDLPWVVSVMQERMKVAGIHPDTDNLEERLNEEMDHAGHAFVRDLAYGICAEK